MDRVFSIIKPSGMTSHDVVYKVRRILSIKKVGHTGTLDPDATGVLPICVGRATKLSDLILNKDKTYLCEMTIGKETDTYDSSGKTIFEKDYSHIIEEDIIDALKNQVGEIDQLPPKYSALKVNGKKMCDLVRSGKEDQIELKSRRITINDIEIKEINIPRVVFEVFCSKGTYVRSICHDVGEILGVGAHMSALTRTKTGIFTLENSITLDELEFYKNQNDLIKHSYSVEEVLKELPYILLKNNAVKYYSNGGTIESHRFQDKNYDDKSKRVRVYSKEGFIGTGLLTSQGEVVSVKSEKLFNI